MRRVVIVLLILVAVGVVVALAVLNSPQPSNNAGTGGSTGTTQQPQPVVEQPTPLPTATPMQMTELVIAVQDIPRGQRIDANTIAVVPWPADAAPVNALTNLEDVIGQIARTDIYREQPILATSSCPISRAWPPSGLMRRWSRPPTGCLSQCP